MGTGATVRDGAEVSDPPSGSTEQRDRAFHAVALVIGAVSMLAFLWMITLGRGDLGQERVYSNVFDLQGRAMAHGRFSVPTNSLYYEGFSIGGRTYTYFGIFPSLIRMPVLAITNRFDGRMTAVSMVVAYLTALWSLARVIVRVRTLVLGDAVWGRRSLVLGGTLFAVLAGGSNLFFLSSGAWVYHEASLWGAAGVFASFAATLRFLARPRLRTVLAAGAWTMIAWTSRGSVGLAPSIVLGLTAMGTVGLLGPFGWLAPAPAPAPAPARGQGLGRRPTRTRRPWALAAALLGAAVAGAVLFAVVNMAKFASPTTVPFSEQVGSSFLPGRQAALAEYHGGLFSPRLILPSLIQTVRPDLIEPTATWPFVAYSGVKPPSIGGVVYDTVEPSSGLTDSSPFLVVLGLLGAVSIVRGGRDGRGGRRRLDMRDHSDDRGRPNTAFLRPFLLGGAAAALPPLTIAFVGQRYVTDALPMLVVAAAAGVAVVDRWSGERSAEPSTGPRSRVGLGAVCTIVALGVLSVALTATLTWYHQRFVVPPDREARAAAIRAQLKVGQVLGSPPSYTRYGLLPPRATRTGIAVVGKCAGLYWGAASEAWEPIEVTPADPMVIGDTYGPLPDGVTRSAPLCGALVAASDG